MYNARAYSAGSETSPLAATTIARRDLTEHDVQIEIMFCGVCHSDLHQVRNEWSSMLPTVYAVVPGHEIVGRVTRIGSGVTKFKEGDLAAVGCLVDSDRTGNDCGQTGTYRWYQFVRVRFFLDGQEKKPRPIKAAAGREFPFREWTADYHPSQVMSSDPGFSPDGLDLPANDPGNAPSPICAAMAFLIILHSAGLITLCASPN